MDDLSPKLHGRSRSRARPSRRARREHARRTKPHFRRVYLTTFSGLNAARHLYEKAGFRLCAEMDGHDLTGAALTEQIFELTRPVAN